MTGRTDSGLMKTLLADRRGDHGVELAGQATLDRPTDRLLRNARSIGADFARLPLYVGRTSLPTLLLLSRQGRLLHIQHYDFAGSRVSRIWKSERIGLLSDDSFGTNQDKLHTGGPAVFTDRLQCHLRPDAVDVADCDSDSFHALEDKKRPRAMRGLSTICSSVLVEEQLGVGWHRPQIRRNNGFQCIDGRTEFVHGSDLRRGFFCCFENGNTSNSLLQ